MQAGVDQANVNIANANAAEQGAIGSMIGGVTSMGSAVLQSGALNSNDAPNEFLIPVAETVVDEVSQTSNDQESNLNLLFNTPSRGDLGSGNN
jgi:hypothetical protein